MKIAPAVYVTLAVIGALWLTKTCSYSAGRADERLLAKDDSLNAVIAASRLETAQREKGFQSARDSTGRVIRALRAKIAPRVIGPNLPNPPTAAYQPAVRDTAHPVVHNPPDSAVVPIAIGDPLLTDSAQTSLTDSLIHAYEKGRRQDSLEILFWRSVVKGYADTLVPALTAARDAWRRQASKPNYAISDIGGGAIVGWGLAEKCESCVVAGAATILLPQLVGAVKRAVLTVPWLLRAVWALF